MKIKDIVSSLRQGPYAWPGGYPKFFITSDGEALSHQGVKQNIWQVLRDTRDKSRSGWCVVGEDINWEDPELFCCHTSKRIESAYAEQETYE